jgi:MerR family transcriptional regulator/heat shock protein HspR
MGGERMPARYSEPLFVISVAARLVEMHPQTLRKYEREGLIAPSRTTGNLRLYSDRDIERLRQVKYLVEERGLNLAGVQLALELTHRLRELRSRLSSDGHVENGAQPDDDSGVEMTRELERLLAMLGFVDEAEVRRGRSERAAGVASSTPTFD